MRISRPKYLELVRRLALVGSTVAPAVMAACGGSSGPANTGGTSLPAPSTSASSASTSTGDSGKDVTVGGGPCRCSWDPDATAAPRVCKKGEMNYAGNRCVPGSHPSYDEGYYPPAVGPLFPPELV